MRIVKKPTYAVESVDNALQLLVMLQEREAIRVGEAAERLGVAPSTAHRLLSTLVYRGFALQDESRRYSAGPALLGPGRQGRLREIVAVATPHLERLAAATLETANLVTRTGTTARFLVSVEGPQLLRIGDRTGTVLPASLSSAGRAMLADLDDDGVRQIYSGRSSQLSGDYLAPDALAELLADLGTVRAQGYALNIGRTEADIAAIGAIVPAPRGRVWLGVSISAPRSRAQSLEAPSTVEALHTCCADIAAELQ